MEDILISIFLKVLNMSMTASYIILAVIIARLLLRRAPKKYSYALWAVALFRLVCPVSFKSVISIFALRPFAFPVKDMAVSSQTAEIVHIPDNIGMMTQPEIQTGLPAVDVVVNESLPAATPMVSANPMQIWEFIGMLLWVAGIIILLVISLISLWRLCRRLRTATVLEGNVWQSESVHSPFIIGLFRPKIYIPYGLTEPALGYVLAHERAHIRRLDHVVRTLAYLVLCLHWFNPLVWLAFYLMGRDMELSCDEKVLERMGDKAEYSETLLSFASPRRFPTPTPLAFGESSVATRIKNALKWRRPRLWVSIIALVLCLAVITACAANPKTEDDGWELAGRWVPVERVYTDALSSSHFNNGDNGCVYEFYEAENRGVRVYDHQSGGYLGGHLTVGEWQEFPYTDEEWAKLSMRYGSTFSEPLSEMYDEILYMGPGPDLNTLPLHDDAELEEFRDQNSFFMRVDGELWYVSTTKDSLGTRRISDIYALQKEEELGKAEFIYPDGTSNEPGIEIKFPKGVRYAYGSCREGSIYTYVMQDPFSWPDGTVSVHAGAILFWSPVQKGSDSQEPQPYSLVENDRIQLSVNFDDGSSLMFSIYVDYNDGVYTLRPVGKGVHLGQSDEGGALLSFDRGDSQPEATATDIPAASPWELLTGLDYDNVSSVMLDRTAAESGNDLNDVARRVIEALHKVSVDEIYVGRGAPNQYYLNLGFNEGKSGIGLGFCGDFVEMKLEGEFAEKYPAEGGPVWEIHNDELTALMERLIEPAAEPDILSGEAESVESMEFLTPGDARAITLGEEFMELALQLLSQGEKTVAAYPDAGTAVPGDMWYALTVSYADGSADLLYIPSGGDSFYRHTDTYGADGTTGYVAVECAELWKMLKEQAGIVERDDLPKLSIGFVNNSDTEAKKLEIRFGSGETSGYSASSSITRGGYTNSANIEPMEKGEEYIANFSAESLGVVAAYDVICIDFVLDGTELGSYTFGRSKIWGGYLSCELRSDGVFTVHARGPNSVTFAYDADANNSLQLDFGEYESLELTYDGGNMMFSSDGVGWKDFTGSRVFFENEDICWSPMEPADDENVPAKHTDSAVVVFSFTRDGTTYGGALSIEGENGLYTVSAQSEAINLGLGSDGRVVVIWD